jgi:uncharacterized membrane protein
VRAAASFLKHPLHPLLVAFPIGLLVASFIFDLLNLWENRELWQTLAFYNMAGGLIGAVLAAVPGLLDYAALKDEKVLQIAHWHFGVNVALLGIYAANVWLRTASGKAYSGDLQIVPFFLSIIGQLLLVVSGWLGGELVYVHGVAVDKPNNTNQS